MLQFASLGSGSKGNATLIQTADSCVLVDCGFGLADSVSRLNNLGVDPASIDAILITHEHGDHANGVGKLSRKFNIPVWSTFGTRSACKDSNFSSSQSIKSERSYKIGELEITPFVVPHDAREPCQFVFSDGRRRMGLLTDLGDVTPIVMQHISELDALLLECNYDHALLQQGKYPPSLKRRVGGRYGHLDNLQSEEILRRINTEQLQYLIGMHISENNNHPDMAYQSLCQGSSCDEDKIILANQQDGFTWKII